MLILIQLKQELTSTLKQFRKNYYNKRKTRFDLSDDTRTLFNDASSIINSSTDPLRIKLELKDRLNKSYGFFSQVNRLKKRLMRILKEEKYSDSRVLFEMHERDRAMIQQLHQDKFTLEGQIATICRQLPQLQELASLKDQLGHATFRVEQQEKEIKLLEDECDQLAEQNAYYKRQLARLGQHSPSEDTRPNPSLPGSCLVPEIEKVAPTSLASDGSESICSFFSSQLS